MPAIGPYSSNDELAKLDGRTREARLLKKTRQDLTRLIGGNPSVAQKMIIDQAAWLTVHVNLMNVKSAEEGGALSERDGRQYLAWSNSLTRLLRQLDAQKVKGDSKPTQSLKGFLAGSVAA